MRVRSLGQMKQEVHNLIGRQDTTMAVRIDQAIIRRYRQVITAHDWDELMDTTEFTATSGSMEYGLPPDVDVIKRLYDLSNNRALRPLSPENLVSRNVASLDQSGTPRAYARTGYMGVQIQPTAATQISFTSSQGTPDFFEVTGLNSDGNSLKEQLSVTGTATVTSVSSYSRIDTIARASFVSPSTINLFAGSTQIGYIPEKETSVRYPWIKFDRSVSSDLTLQVLYQKNVPDLTQFGDVCAIDCEDVVVQGAFADVLKSVKQHSKARLEDQVFREMLEDYITHRTSADEDLQVLPDPLWLRQRDSLDRSHYWHYSDE